MSHLFWVRTRSIFLSSLLVTGLWQGLHYKGNFEFLELILFDRFVRQQAPLSPDSRLLLVTITEEDLHRHGWPITDDVLAATLQSLQKHQPRVIGLDLYRDLPNPPGQEALSQQLQADNLIAIEEVVGNIPPPPQVSRDRVGFNDLILDRDGVLRRSLLLVTAPEEDYYSFALRLSRQYLAPEGINFRLGDRALWFNNIPLLPLNPHAGGYQNADTNGYQMLIDYRNSNNLAPTVTLSQVLDNTVPPDLIAGKIVLIGTVASSLKDFVLTPYSASRSDDFQMSGVMIHAQIVSQLLDLATQERHPFYYATQWQEMLWLWGWTILGSALAWLFKHPLALGSLSILSVLGLGGIGWILFSQQIWLPVVAPALGFELALGLAMSHRLLYTTTRDPLTGLLNRTSFIHHLKRRLQPSPVALGVIFIELDRLDLVANSLGNSISDRLLLAAVTRLKSVVPRAAHLARIGNNKFALALWQTHPDTLIQQADRVHQVLAKPFNIVQKELVTASNIGIAIAQPQRQHNAAHLLRDAHTAMYRAKALGTDRYEVFAQGMLEEVVDRFTLENELRQAIAKQEFALYYQPIVSLANEQITGFEALIRWHHPQRGFISPGRFIPVAEETGLIVPLGEWICQTACQQSAQWSQQFPNLPLIISVNLSGRQFQETQLIHKLAYFIKSAGIPASNLKLEITESMVMQNVEAAIDLMLGFKALGCKLSLDDFGTGYSSLSQLRRFPVDTLKVDRSFVVKMGQSPEDRQIVRMIVDLGHLLGMDIIAEGIENEQDRDRLRSLMCEYGQGYFWSKPVSVAEATQLLQQQP
ncbi:MAG: EAL domain-containing protein [Jaaginema sp. PMC 1079.18]|nr:EAL domain-containing protein [Jaaginema sp. PMC 1080.18]MEC4849988.1 EAL domain-containing protein [Jaaginema sp. PMC 1079.18]MEC4865182.1 EAL domain-containing protein [Jaaginema sp. PMC 1078.18]